MHYAVYTSTLYLLRTGRMPIGTGRMGPLSMSVGPSIGGRSDFPDGPIFRSRKTLIHQGIKTNLKSADMQINGPPN